MPRADNHFVTYLSTIRTCLRVGLKWLPAAGAGIATTYLIGRRLTHKDEEFVLNGSFLPPSMQVGLRQPSPTYRGKERPYDEILRGVSVGLVNSHPSGQHFKGLAVGLYNQQRGRTDGIRLGLVNVGGRVDGAEIGLWNASRDINGLAVGVGNWVDGKIVGVGLGFFNISDSAISSEGELGMRGFQVGMINSTGGPMQGLQFALLGNISHDDMDGVQLGFFNLSQLGGASGLKVGIINGIRGENKGLSIGLLNSSGIRVRYSESD